VPHVLPVEIEGDHVSILIRGARRICDSWQWKSIYGVALIIAFPMSHTTTTFTSSFNFSFLAIVFCAVVILRQGIMAIDRFEFSSLKARASIGRPVFYYLKFLLPTILILATSTYLWTHDVTVDVPEYKHVYSVEGRKERFVEQFIKNEIDGPYNSKPLREMCASKKRKFQPGLVIQCNPPIGGFGNIKNMMLNCLRFSLEAGGKLFLPMYCGLSPLTPRSDRICSSSVRDTFQIGERLACMQLLASNWRTKC